MDVRFIRSSGQSLLEVIFVAVIIAVALGAFVFTATRSLKSSTTTASRSLATKYAQDGMELVRQLRNKSWTEFSSYTGDMCPSTWTTGECTIPTNTAYKQKAIFKLESPTRMKVTVTVTWSDEIEHTSTLVSYFTKQ